MTISKEAIEAAAEGAWTADRPSDARKWDVVSKIEKDAYRAVARAALEAAAPLLMAQALREVLTWAEEQHPWIGLMDLKDHIEERANELEGKA